MYMYVCVHTTHTHTRTHPHTYIYTCCRAHSRLVLQDADTRLAYDAKCEKCQSTVIKESDSTALQKRNHICICMCVYTTHTHKHTQTFRRTHTYTCCRVPSEQVLRAPDARLAYDAEGAVAFGWTLTRKVPENRDQGIGLNGCVKKNKSLPCSLKAKKMAKYIRPT